MLQLSYSQLANRRAKATSREKFAWGLFFRDYFTREERINRNVNGIGGRAKLNPMKLQAIRDHTFRMWPVTSPGNMKKEDEAWKEFLKLITKNNSNNK